MSCSYNISVNEKTTGKEIAKYSQQNVNCKKNQTFTVDYDNSKPLTFQCPVDTISEPIMDSDGKATNLSYNGQCQYDNNNRPEPITIVFGVISCFLFLLVIGLFITRKK